MWYLYYLEHVRFLETWLVHRKHGVIFHHNYMFKSNICEDAMMTMKMKKAPVSGVVDE